MAPTTRRIPDASIAFTAHSFDHAVKYIRRVIYGPLSPLGSTPGRFWMTDGS